MAAEQGCVDPLITHPRRLFGSKAPQPDREQDSKYMTSQSKRLWRILALAKTKAWTVLNLP